MSIVNRRLRNRPAATRVTAAIVTAAGLGLLGPGLLGIAGCATPGGGAVTTGRPVVTDAQFCVDAQTHITGSRPRAANTVYTDYQAFVESKPAARPLETRQYVWFADEARAQPKMVSCKMKTADHIRVEYGADQVGADTSCAAVNERTLEAVRGALTRIERQRLKFDSGRRVVFDADTVTTNGPIWLEPFALAYLAPDGALHVKAKGMKNDWLDPRLAKAEARFKGTRYCHLVAPEYLRRILLGEVTL